MLQNAGIIPNLIFGHSGLHLFPPFFIILAEQHVSGVCCDNSTLQLGKLVLLAGNVTRLDGGQIHVLNNPLPLL